MSKDLEARLLAVSGAAIIALMCRDPQRAVQNQTVFTNCVAGKNSFGAGDAFSGMLKPTPQVANCRNCGAPPPIGSPDCAYCGTPRS